MGFTAFEETSIQFPEVPFVNEYSDRKKKDGSLFAVQSIFLSEKGIMAFTSSFKVFIWKNEKLHNQLLEKIGTTLSQEETMDCFSIQLVAATKKCFVAGFDDSIQGYWVEDGKFYSFTQSSTVPSNLPIEGLEVPKQIDSSPRTGRKAS